MSSYSLRFVPEVISGAGSLMELIYRLNDRNYSKITFIVDRGVVNNKHLQELISILKKTCSLSLITDVPPEPKIHDVEMTFAKLLTNVPEVIIAIGGGSIIDTAKITSVMLTNSEYREDITDSSLIVRPGVPLFAVPTSAGTGAEATPNAIVLVPDKQIKLGVVNNLFLPSLIVLDPELTCSMPSAVTAATGIDALCHCIETFISKKSNEMTGIFSLRGIELIFKYLKRAYDDGFDIEAREAMLAAAFCGGVAICSSSTVGVHALSYPLGGKYHIPHGISNAILLKPVMDFSLQGVEEKNYEIAKAMGIPIAKHSKEEIRGLISEKIGDLIEYINIPNSLTSFGISEEDIDFLAVSASQVHRLIDNNPMPLSLDDIKRIYKELLGGKNE